MEGGGDPIARGNTQILHHAVVAVEHDVAVGDEIAGKALVARAEGNAQVFL